MATTIRQIAQLAGVSRGTVDRVLNNRPGVKPETAEAVRKIMEELDYRPNLAGKILAAGKQRLRLGFLIPHGPEFIFYLDILHAAQKKAEELRDLGVEVLFYFLSSFSPDHLSSVARQIASDGLSGLAMNPCGNPQLLALSRSFADRNVPVVFYNMDQPGEPRLCYVGCDYEKAGRVAAGLCALATGGTGTVALITTHNAQIPSFVDRATGFIRELSQRCPDIHLLNNGAPIVFLHDNYTPVYQLFQAHPQLDAVYIVNPGDFSVCREAKKAAGGRPLRIITNDLIPAQREMLREGIISATLGQQPELQGSLPLQLLYEALVYGTAPASGCVHTELNIYIPQNI